MAKPVIGVINAGSSSLKFSVYEETPVLSGQVDGIGVHPSARAIGAGGERLEAPDVARASPATPADVLPLLLPWLRERLGERALAALGHRVVHGGVSHTRPERVTAELLRELTGVTELAPLHLPHNLAPMRAVLEHAPELPQVACFDTAFHRTTAMPVLRSPKWHLAEKAPPGGSMHIDPAILSPASALLGALIGGGASVVAAMYTQRFQDRLQRVSFEIAKRETVYSEFVMNTSNVLLSAYIHDEIVLTGDEQRLGGLINRMRFFAPSGVISAAEAVLKAIIEIALKPSVELRQLAKEALSKSPDPDPLVSFSVLCRADLDNVRKTMA